MITIAFFNNKGGVGKTSLCYHLAWMLSELGMNVMAADLDPQANLTSMFLPEERLQEIWADDEHPDTIWGAIRPILRGLGDIADIPPEPISDNIGLINGDLGLSNFEDKLSDSWPRCNDGDEAAFRVISSFFRILSQAAQRKGADLALIDVGPNLGAINRAAIIAANYIVIPLAPDLYSLQGLRNLGPTLIKWRADWRDRLKKKPSDLPLPLPSGDMGPIGYVIMQHAIRADRPVKAYAKWIDKIPEEYRSSVLQEEKKITRFKEITTDPYCLALLKHYRSLMPMAMEARKPMFHLTPADGAIGAHTQAVQDCYQDFKKLAQRIAQQCRISLP